MRLDLAELETLVLSVDVYNQHSGVSLEQYAAINELINLGYEVLSFLKVFGSCCIEVDL